MFRLLASLLGIVILSVVILNLQHKKVGDLEQQIYQEEVIEAASQEAAFARAVTDYIEANSVANGTVLTPAQLSAAGVLAPGYPATNPFGQAPEAIVGINKAALITYTGLPDQSAFGGISMNTNSAIDQRAFALLEATDIAAMQTGMPQLVGGVLSGGAIMTPMQNQNITATTYLPGDTLPGGTIFVDMLDILPVPVSNSSSGYSPTTGD